MESPKIIALIGAFPIYEQRAIKHDPANGQFTSSGGSGKKLKAADYSKHAWEHNTVEAHHTAAEMHEKDAKRHDKNGNAYQASRSRETAQTHREYGTSAAIAHEKHAQAWQANLSKEEAKAKQFYQGHGATFLNRALREGKGTISQHPLDYDWNAQHAAIVRGEKPQLGTIIRRTDVNLDELRKHSHHLDAAISKGHAADNYQAKRLLVYTPELEKAFKPGVEFTDHGYVSTSLTGGDFSHFLSKQVPRPIGSPEPTKVKAITMHIPISKGTVGAPLPNGGAHVLNEFLLPRGSRFKVNKTETDSDGNLHVHTELVH